jgi:hypothetical protein
MGGGLGDLEGMCTRHAGVMLCIVFVTMLQDMVDDSSTSTICLYLSQSLLCLIKQQVCTLDLLSFLVSLCIDTFGLWSSYLSVT